MSPSSVRVSAESVLAPLLGPGENLFWSGQPLGGIRLRQEDVGLIPFSLVWGGFAIFWETMAVTKVLPSAGPIGIVFVLFGVPFVVIGLYLIFGRFFVEAARRAHTYYGVTSDRILVVTGQSTRKTQSFPLGELADVQMTQRKDGLGTITFGSPLFLPNRFVSRSWRGMSVPFARLDLVPNVKEVYDIIAYAQRSAKGKSASTEEERED